MGRGLCSESLGRHSDQLIEAMHQYMDKLLQQSGYWVNNEASDVCGDNLERAVHHLNAYNL